MNDQYWSIVRPIKHSEQTAIKSAPLNTREIPVSEVTIQSAPGRWDVKVAGITVGTYDSKAEAEAEKRRYERDIEAEKARDVTR